VKLFILLFGLFNNSCSIKDSDGGQLHSKYIVNSQKNLQKGGLNISYIFNYKLASNNENLL
jgi:hypothetical protein